MFSVGVVYLAAVLVVPGIALGAAWALVEHLLKAVANVHYFYRG